MAIVACKECGKDVSSEAKSCPHCGIGRPGPSKGLMSLAGIFALLLVGYTIFSLGRPSVGSTSSASSSAAACSPDHFTVDKLNGTQDGEYAHLTGIIRHDCPVAVGVQLAWTAYNPDGSVAFSDKFWPASTTNIAPNTDYPFDTMNQAPRGKWTFRVVPIEINTW